MRAVGVLVALVTAVRGQVATTATWTTQSPMLPEYEWVVLDHADGNSMGYGVTTAGNYVFVSGSMSTVVRIENPATGAAVESMDQGGDGDIYLAKISLEGEPTAVWSYAGSSNEFPAHLATSPDEASLAMTGYFSGNITFGTYTFDNEKPDDRDGFVVKVGVEDGAVAWARHFPSDAGTLPGGVAHDEDGNVCSVGQRCDLVDDGTGTTAEVCHGYVTLLSGDDGSTIWDVNYGPAVTTLTDVVLSSDASTFYVVGSTMSGTVDLGGAVGNVTTSEDAILVALDAATYATTWAATVSGGTAPSSGNLVETLGTDIYVSCIGACSVATSTASSETAALQGLYGGAVVKFDGTSGAPLWAADVPGPQGMATNADSVFVTAHASGTMSVGDASFTSRGSFDQYIFRLNAQTGSGVWVLQNGGYGLEYVRRMTTDPEGNLYSIGLTQSNPSHFGNNIVLDTHDHTDGYDVFIAKLTTSSDTLPSCKVSDTEVAADACFVGNVCFQAMAMSLTAGEQCKYCDPTAAQDSFQGVNLTGTYGCFIDGICVADGGFRSIPAASPFAPPSQSECEVCNATVSQDSWTMLDDYMFMDGSCLFAPFGVIAGYAPSSSVMTHSMIDLDQAEIELLSDAADFEAARFVYENGGGGLCNATDILTTVATDSCYGKNITDAKGNSIKGSGDIRTIYGFATSGREKMANWPHWNMYRDYYDDDNYADTFIQNALSPTGAWASRSDALRAELAIKGASYLAVWMYVIHEMEDAVADCRAGDIFDNDGAAGGSPHAWDEAWAFYTGSLEGMDGSGTGKLLWDLAEKRAPQFGTADDSGMSMANKNALMIANDGLEKILAMDCDGVAEQIPKWVVQMTIPPMQGMIRYVYLADPMVNNGTCDATTNVCTYDKAWSEAWAFAAAVLPQIAACDATVAAEIVENLDVDTPVGAPMVDGFRYVKQIIESTYPCLGITCADIGEYLQDDGTPYPGMEKCVD